MLCTLPSYASVYLIAMHVHVFSKDSVSGCVVYECGGVIRLRLATPWPLLASFAPQQVGTRGLGARYAGGHARVDSFSDQLLILVLVRLHKPKAPIQRYTARYRVNALIR